MTLGKKLLVTFLLCGLVPTAVISVLGYQSARNGMGQVANEAENKLDGQLVARLEAVRDNKALTVSDYFRSIEKQIRTFSRQPSIVEAMLELPTAANPYPLGSKQEQAKASTDLEYDRLHESIHTSVRSYLEEFGYQDVFLIDTDTGRILYSADKEVDYATSLLDGPYSATSLADVYKQARGASSPGETFFTDFRPYGPSYEAPSGFVSSAIFDGPKKVGVVVFQMPLEQITEVMSVRSGLGETGESYLIGADYLMRSDSFRDPDRRSVAASFRDPLAGSVKTEPATAALSGRSGSGHHTSYGGLDVISAYGPVDVLGQRWGLIVEISEEEGRAFATAMDEVSAAETRELVVWIAISAALTGMAVGLVGLFMTRSVDGPLIVAVRALSREAENVNMTASRMSMSSKQLAASARTQAASLEETSSSLEELSAMTSHNAENATEANSLAVQARGSAEESDRTIASLREAIGKINDSSYRISSIIKVIEDTAFQTNLLALNAAVEAARAGDHGKGFAVVADEVRSLAQKATAAAQETSNLIEDSVDRAREGNQAMEGMEAVLGEIVQRVARVSELMDGISSATSEQARGVEQISRGAERMDQVTQQTAAAAEGASTLSQELAGRAAQVQSVVSGLEALVGAGGEARVENRSSSRLVRPDRYRNPEPGETREAA